ncbi:levansucrase [Virgibacillus indicus]|uniref:Levansucrase n=1 Tax=Virgibacillus indicus TaxID=2024554 RepID=A0A265N6R7_9BACI|nr:PRD domain-containing protein [Virgibacillus indicus]OZU87708.1 levansucrase [Virgibacillus indicus]
MKITKILNNNAVVVMDKNEEKIAIGGGVGFNKGKNDIVNNAKIEKLFVLKENEKLQRLFARIPEEHILIAEEIIAYAEEMLNTKLDEHIRLALTDHISFAIEREKKGIHLRNKLLQEVKVLYKKEFEIGLWALDHVEEKLQIRMPIDEAAFIALHIHAMKIQGGDLHEIVRLTSILKDMVQTINDDLDITVEEDDIAYERLITHLRFAIMRLNSNELHTMDEEMFKMMKKKFTLSFNCAKKVADKLDTEHGITLPEEELGYITLHIERLRSLQS